MQKRRILITGGSGLLGANLSRVAITKDWDACFIFNKHAVSISKCKGIKLDLTDYKETEKIVLQAMPDVIVHCAALTNVDYCESHADEAVLINAGITANLAKISKDKGIKFIYISTDAVFDGIKGNYSELDVPNPVNVYGKSKLLGELETKTNCDDYIIVRTSIYGWNILDKLSLVELFIYKLERDELMQGWRDVYFSPIFVNNFSEIMLEICSRDIRGVLNISGSERCSKFDFVKMVARVFGYRDNRIDSVSIEEYHCLKAKRPKDVSLDASKIKGLCLRSKMLGIRDGLEYMKKLKEDGYVKQLKDGCNCSCV